MTEPQWQSQQWQQFDQRERETAEFARLVAQAVAEDHSQN